MWAKHTPKIMNWNVQFHRVRVVDQYFIMVYALTFQEVIENPSLSVSTHGHTGNHRNPGKIDLQGFADDHALKNSFQAKSRVAKQTSIELLENTAINVKSWMDENWLCMNDWKTEFIMFRSRQMLQLCTMNFIQVNGCNIARSKVIRYLGAWLDQSLQLKIHINNKCRIAMLNFQRVKLVRPFLMESAAHTLVIGLITSHLDYCNTIFSGIPNCLLDHLQHVQNAAAKLVCNKRKYDSTRDCLMYLHWLPIRARIDYKIAVMVHKCLNDKAPDYLKDLLTVNQPTRVGLRSSQFSNILVIPHTKCKTFADRAFSVYRPRTWNLLPEYLRNECNTEIFKCKLKTHLFQKSYNIF